MKLFKKCSTSFKELIVFFLQVLKSMCFLWLLLFKLIPPIDCENNAFAKMLFLLYNMLCIKKDCMIRKEFATNMEIKENERIDDLQFKGLKIIQNKESFCFGVDSILLTDFASKIKNGCKVLDLGTGTGVIAILLAAKTKLKHIIGVEKQTEMAELANRNVKLNNLGNKVKIVNLDVLNLSELYTKNSFDVVVTNPPYKKKNTGVINQTEKKYLARHELTATLEDFIKISNDMLKENGEFYMVHKPERLVDIISSMRLNNLEPKKLRFVFSNIHKEPSLILVKGVKGGKPFLKIEKNLYIYDENGNYTEEINKIYNKE